MKWLLSFLCVLQAAGQEVAAQKIQILTSGTKTSIRGLSVVDDKVVWLSGSNGSVGKSLDSGKTWKWMTVEGFEKRDFRDIEAFDAATAIIIAVAEPAYILKTINGGQTWKVVYENKTPGMFLDALEFWNEQSGLVLGDPVHGRFFLATTSDAGRTWTELPFNDLPAADSGEACFAASGTNIRKLARDKACFVSGGVRSRFLFKDQPVDLPFARGTQTAGANSIALREQKGRKSSNYMVVVGGDFAADRIAEKNCFISKDGGLTWATPVVSPHGYRSCVEFISKDSFLCCGTSGVDISLDGGLNWALISEEGYHVCRKAKKGKAVFLAGGDGKVAKLVLE